MPRRCWPRGGAFRTRSFSASKRGDRRDGEHGPCPLLGSQPPAKRKSASCFVVCAPTARTTFAVVAYLSLFLVLTGGSAVALTGSNTVFSDDITNNEVRTADVRNDDLRGGGLASGDIRRNALTGADVNESTFGKVPNTDTVDGKDSTELGVRAYAFVQGSLCRPSEGNVCPLDRNKNVAYAIKVGTGRYCVGVNGIDASAPNSLATVGVADNGSNANADETVVWEKQNSACVAREFEVQTYIQATFAARRADGGVSEATTPGRPDDRVFFIAIP